MPQSVAHQFAEVVEREGFGSALIKLPPTAQRNGTSGKEAVILLFEDDSEFGFYFNSLFWTKAAP